MNVGFHSVPEETRENVRSYVNFEESIFWRKIEIRVTMQERAKLLGPSLR